MKFTDNESLLNKAKNGDLRAFEELASMHYTKVYNVCFRMTNNTDDASEMAQETFIKAYKNIKSFKGNSSLFTWLYRIASNICLDFLRKNSKNKTISLDQNAYENLQLQNKISDNNPQPDEVVELNAQRHAIKEALEKMNINNKNIIIMRDFMNLSYDEIASVLNCPLGTVKSRVSRARSELRDLLCNDKEQLFADFVQNNRREG
jgi:RNA polymerase sigma-70 factor (ECF subfamily)